MSDYETWQNNVQVSALQIWSPAKVNLALYVRGRRPDGYHLLESLVVPVTLYDRVALVVEESSSLYQTPQIEVDSSGFAVPTGPENLAARAAVAFLEALGRPTPRIRIHLEKNIPAGAGLGGGSSNAAAVLLLLQTALGSPLTWERLLEIAGHLGSDVPFFLVGRPAIMRGIGEELEPVDLPRKFHLVLCGNGTVLLSKEVYAQARVTLTDFSRASNIGHFLMGMSSIVDILHNDLERAAAVLEPSIPTLKEATVRAGAVSACMTGSGSCVFGVCPSRTQAVETAARLRAMGFWAQAAETLSSAWALCL